MARVVTVSIYIYTNRNRSGTFTEGSYNAYKNQISVIEKGEAQPGPGTAAFWGISDSPITSPATPGNVSSADEAAASLAQKPDAATSPAANGPPHPARLSSEGTDNSEANYSLEDTDGFSSEGGGGDLASLKAR